MNNHKAPATNKKLNQGHGTMRRQDMDLILSKVSLESASAASIIDGVFALKSLANKAGSGAGLSGLKKDTAVALESIGFNEVDLSGVVSNEGLIDFVKGAIGSLFDSAKKIAPVLDERQAQIQEKLKNIKKEHAQRLFEIIKQEDKLGLSVDGQFDDVKIIAGMGFFNKTTTLAQSLAGAMTSYTQFDKMMGAINKSSEQMLKTKYKDLSQILKDVTQILNIPSSVFYTLNKYPGVTGMPAGTVFHQNILGGRLHALKLPGALTVKNISSEEFGSIKKYAIPWTSGVSVKSIALAGTSDLETLSEFLNKFNDVESSLNSGKLVSLKEESDDDIEAFVERFVEDNPDDYDAQILVNGIFASLMYVVYDAFLEIWGAIDATISATLSYIEKSINVKSAS